MMAYQVRRADWMGEEIVELVDSDAGMTARLAPQLGGNLFSLWSEPHQHEILLAPESPAQLVERPTRFGVPLLMPPGRLWQGRFAYAGHTYQFDLNRGEHHSHGLVLTLPWTVEEEQAGPDCASVTIGVRSWQFFNVLRQFPHAFHLWVQYRLADGVLTCTSWITNEGDRAMPFGMGFHTYFHLPGDTNAWTVKLAADERLALEAGFPTGERLPVRGEYDLRRGRPVGQGALDDLFLQLGRDQDGWSQVELASAERGLRVLCEADEHFPFWVLFSGSMGERGFLAPEPYTITANGFNLPPTLSGIREVPAGVTVTVGTWRIRIGS